MGIRHWFRDRLLDGDTPGDDVPPGGALVNTAFGRGGEPIHALGEYVEETYPEDLAELLRRRTNVTSEVIRMDITDRDARMAAVPRLTQLLRVYPHPLVYELLINAFLDAGKFDEAKGVAFAARARREECERSPFPEIRSEVDRLREWSPEDVEEVRREREK